MSYKVKITRDCDDAWYHFPYVPYFRKYVIEVYRCTELVRRQRIFGVIFRRRLLKKLKNRAKYELEAAKLMAKAEDMAA